MPANLPPDYFAAEKRYREARKPQEKIDRLHEMLALMPKHKGTDHLQGDIKRRIAKLQAQSQKKTATTRSSGFDHIPREGAGQAVLVGPPNSGKSTLLNQLTNARSDVADFPFSTFRPIQGMMQYEDIQIQLVDLPPVSERYAEPWLYNIIRLADLVLLVVDLSSAQTESVLQTCRDSLEQHKILLRERGERTPQGPIAVKSALLVGAKCDIAETERQTLSLVGDNGQAIPFVNVSAGEELENLKKAILQALRVIRIYTKTPGKQSDLDKPYILDVGSTVLDAARAIHKDLAETMRFARIWGKDKYDGQRIERESILSDGDILEIHTR